MLNIFPIAYQIAQEILDMFDDESLKSLDIHTKLVFFDSIR